MLNTVRKIGPVLELFTPEQPEWRGADVARTLQMPKTSAYSLLATLVEVGLLSVSDGGAYRLGWNLLSLSDRMRSGLAFRRHAVGPMHALSRDINETVLLAALDHHEVIYLERFEGQHATVRLAGVRPGARLPAQATAVGKVLLAHLDPLEVQMRMARASWPALTARTTTSLSALKQELCTVQATGVAFDLGEVVPDVACVAGPVRDARGAVVAAISISLPAYRFEERRAVLVKRLIRTCDTVTLATVAASDDEEPSADFRVDAVTPV